MNEDLLGIHGFGQGAIKTQIYTQLIEKGIVPNDKQWNNLITALKSLTIETMGGKKWASSSGDKEIRCQIQGGSLYLPITVDILAFRPSFLFLIVQSQDIINSSSRSYKNNNIVVCDKNIFGAGGYSGNPYSLQRDGMGTVESGRSDYGYSFTNSGALQNYSGVIKDDGFSIDVDVTSANGSYQGVTSKYTWIAIE